MDYDTTANPAGDDDSRLEETVSLEAGAEAYAVDDGMTEPPGSGEGEEHDPFDDHDDSTEEVEYEGRRYEVPRPLKGALLRQADYTRKTMELADQRRALAASQAELEHAHAMTADEFRAASRLSEVEAELEDLAQLDWSGLDPRHPEVAQLRFTVEQLAQEQVALHGALSEHYHYRSAREQQEAARTRAETDQAMAREIQDWSPEQRHLLESFAVHHGVPEDHLDHASPAEMRILHLAYYGAQQLERQRAANRGAFRPAAEVGTSAGAGPSDPSRMTMAQYRAWRAKQK